jgi:putative heme-binding domain-containing protein
VLRSHPVAEVAQRARQFFGPAPIQRQQVVEQFQPALKLAGSGRGGQQIYSQRCASCHTAGNGQGMELAHVKNRSAARLLTDILDPSRDIPGEWVTCIVVTRTGEVRVGTLENANLETVVVREPAGTLVVWPRSRVQLLQTQPWSIMPAGLEQGLSAQSIADLVAFLRE